MTAARSVIDPIEVVQPSPAVADATIRVVSELVLQREEKGLPSAEAEAMGIVSGGLAFLRGSVGVEGVDRILGIAKAENDKAAARDSVSRDIGISRRHRARQRSERRAPP